jgi:hypothetical protein
VGCSLPTNLNEVTGMVAIDKGIAVIEGHNDNPSNVRISVLDAACKATTTNYTGPDPLDPQDLAIGSDGAYWVADIGDTQDGDPSRERIAVEKAPAGGGKATIYRFQYPGGVSLDAQAMLLDKGDVPIILAHDAGGKTGIYKPATPLQADITENLPQMTKLGDFTPAKTDTANPKGPIGQQLVTGAAKAPDGKHVVIRTMSDAYEFEVGADGDVAKAITTGKPAVTPLPNEPQGEAITYSLDGTKFITLSVMPSDATKTPTLLTYARYIPPPPEPEAPSEPQAPAEEQGFLQKLSFSEMTRIVAAVGVVGLVLAIAGIIGIRRARRRRREEEEYDDYDDYDDDPRPRRGRGRGRGHDDGYGGLREPAYSGGYDDQGGYGDTGYGRQQLRQWAAMAPTATAAPAMSTPGTVPSRSSTPTTAARPAMSTPGTVPSRSSTPTTAARPAMSTPRTAASSSSTPTTAASSRASTAATGTRTTSTRCRTPAAARSFVIMAVGACVDLQPRPDGHDRWVTLDAPRSSRRERARRGPNAGLADH